MKRKQEYAPEQIKAIKKNVSLGRQLQIDHPEIADLYKAGAFHPEIAATLNVRSKYGVDDKIAKEAVAIALRGHEGGFDSQPFVGLIDDQEELEKLALEHQVEMGRKSGTKVRQEGIGIFGRTSNQMSEDGRNAGLKSYRDGKGVHGRTPEQMVEHALRSNIAQGVTPWIPRKETETYVRFSEVEYARRMSQTFLFQHPKGSRFAGKPDWSLIADTLNREYHGGKPIRNRNTTREAVRREFKLKK